MSSKISREMSDALGPYTANVIAITDELINWRDRDGAPCDEYEDWIGFCREVALVFNNHWHARTTEDWYGKLEAVGAAVMAAVKQRERLLYLDEIQHIVRQTINDYVKDVPPGGYPPDELQAYAAHRRDRQREFQAGVQTAVANWLPAARKDPLQAYREACYDAATEIRRLLLCMGSGAGTPDEFEVQLDTYQHATILQHRLEDLASKGPGYSRYRPFYTSNGKESDDDDEETSGSPECAPAV